MFVVAVEEEGEGEGIQASSSHEADESVVTVREPSEDVAMDLTRYLPQTGDTNGTDTPPGPGGEGRDEGHASSSAPTSASGQGFSDGHGGGLTRSLSLTERTRLNLSHTWYSIADYLGLQRLKAIMSGMNTLPETTEPLYLLGKRYESLNKGE